jgi:hypothetical protein
MAIALFFLYEAKTGIWINSDPFIRKLYNNLILKTFVANIVSLLVISLAGFRGNKILLILFKRKPKSNEVQPEPLPKKALKIWPS